MKRDSCAAIVTRAAPETHLTPVLWLVLLTCWCARLPGLENYSLAAARLDEYRVRDEWERWKNIARSFGYLFFTLGLGLLALIVYAMAARLLR